ncbi:MAG: hypothetical protein NWF03_01415 [Candidatus Bathyarchaeota archaeon]|nr:hypothetical protein [Candidatus Bathyarchaeota archaeon]
MPKKRKEKQISVRAPDFIPKKEPIFKDTTGTEALDVFKGADIVGRYFSFVMMAFGIFVTVFSVYSISTSVDMLLNPLFITVLGLVAALNIFCGLLLLAKK